MDKRDFKAGELLVLSTGCYSDYSFSGPFRVLKDFNINAEADKYAKGFVGEYKWDSPNPSGFTAALAVQGFIEDTDSVEVHIGEYSDLEIDKNHTAEWKKARDENA